MKYTEFVAKHRRAGKSMKEIGALWQLEKTKHSASAAIKDVRSQPK